jgi:hypothetical protein
MISATLDCRYHLDAHRRVPTKPTARFVVRPLDAGRAASGASPPEGLGDAVPLASPRGGWAVDAAGDPSSSASLRKTWRALAERAGGAYVVAPVLAGDEGAERYPTGLVSVRFRDAMADAQLQHFAQQAGLRLVQRTRFTDRQALFGLLDAPHTYLPDLLQRLAQMEPVESAWPDAESAYHRAG